MEEKNLKEKEVTYFYKHTVFVSVGEKKKGNNKKTTKNWVSALLLAKLLF